jgi:hypothetical protein
MITLRRFELEAFIKLAQEQLLFADAGNKEMTAVVRIAESENEDVIRVEFVTESGNVTAYKL